MKRILLCCAAGRFASVDVNTRRPKVKTYARHVNTSERRPVITSAFFSRGCSLAQRHISGPADTDITPIKTAIAFAALPAGNNKMTLSENNVADVPQFVA